MSHKAIMLCPNCGHKDLQIQGLLAYFRDMQGTMRVAAEGDVNNGSSTLVSRHQDGNPSQFGDAVTMRAVCDGGCCQTFHVDMYEEDDMVIQRIRKEGEQE